MVRTKFKAASLCCKQNTDHCTTSDLILLKWLLKFLKHSQVANVASNSLASRAKRAQSIGDVDIYLSRICLTGYNVCGLKARLLCDKFVELFDLLVISVEDFFDGLGFELAADV